jgi:curved DNA-binding protein CbpA
MAGGNATYYAVLGVAWNASAAEIRSAWRNLSLVSARRALFV